MIRRIRAAFLAALSTLTLATVAAPAAHAGVLSLLPGSCGSQPESQPFAQWGDFSEYTPVPGGNFEPGSVPWALRGGAHVVSGNESYQVGGAGDSQALALPAGSSATSPFSCTSIYHPTARLFVRNSGSATSHLIVQAIYPTLLGTGVSTIGQVTGSSNWQPSPAMSLLVDNLLSTLTLNRTTIAFRFIPADSTGNWSIDDVYLDPFMRA